MFCECIVNEWIEKDFCFPMKTVSNKKRAYAQDKDLVCTLFRAYAVFFLRSRRMIPVTIEIRLITSQMTPPIENTRAS